MTTITSSQWQLSFFALLAWVGTSAGQETRPQKPHEGPGLEQARALRARPLKELPDDDELGKLLKARYNQAVGEVNGWYDLLHLDGSFDDQIYGSWHRLVKAGLDVL